MSFYRPGGSGSGSVTTTPVQVGEGGTGATTASAARTNLGLGTIATQNANNVSITGGTVINVSDIAVADGGTGASTADGALANLLPSYSNNANKVLSVKSDASGVEWTTNGAGTVTSVAASVPTGLSISGTPITSSGTLAITYASGYAIPTTAKQTDWDTAYTDRLKWDGGATGLTASTGRTSLGLGTIATQDASNVAITGGSVSGITDLAVADGGTGASTAANARINLLPSYTSNGSKVLALNSGATDVEWISAGGSGTVTSVDLSVPTGLAVSGNPVTTSGTLAITFASGYSIPTTTKQSEWDTAYTDRLKWDGGSTGLTASTGRTSLGATTVGANIFTLTNPSAVTFVRMNADNTVTARSASELKTDLSLNNVENTALSTWAGSANITTVGTVSTGTIAGGTY
jgi:hypothetical protein